MNNRLISGIVLWFFLHMIIMPFYPAEVQAAEQLSISGLTVVKLSFLPYRNTGKFSFFLNRASQITAEIQDSDFNLVRSLALMDPRESGENIIEWGGKDMNGNFIQDGKYIVSVSAMTEDGGAAMLSKEMTLELDASEGTEFKESVYEIEGKPKKEHIQEVPLTMRAGELLSDCYGVGVSLILFPLTLIILISNMLRKSILNTHGAVIYYERDYEKLTKINQKIDKYNAEIDEEIAKKNRKIDEFNDKVKDTVTIRIKMVS